MKREKAVNLVIFTVFIFSNFIVFFPNFLSEFDFWAGTIMLVVLAIFEVHLYNKYISPKSAVEEINRNSIIQIPSYFNFIFKYILPIILLFLFSSWIFSDITSDSSVILKNDFWTLLSRGILIIIFLFLYKLIRRKD